jgi:hypothetical protein
MTADDSAKLDQVRRFVREASLTETISVTSPTDVPHGYVPFPFPSPPIYGRAQVLSRQNLRPIFIERDPQEGNRRIAFWVHRSVLPDLSRWIRIRVFTRREIVDDLR